MTFEEMLKRIKTEANVKFRLPHWYEGQFIFLVNGSKFQVNRPPLNEMFEEGTTVKYNPHIDLMMGDEDGNPVVAVWNPTQIDIFSDDWEVVE